MSREHEEFTKHIIYRQIDTTVIVSACFPLVENIVAWLFQRRGRKWTNQVTISDHDHHEHDHHYHHHYHQVIIERCRQVLHARHLSMIT